MATKTDTTFGVENVVPGDILFLVDQTTESDDACERSTGHGGYRTLEDAQRVCAELKSVPKPAKTGYRETISIEKWTAPQLCPGFPTNEEDFETVIEWRRTTKRDWKIYAPLAKLEAR